MSESDRQALRELVEGARLPAERIAADTRSIYESILATSRHVKTPNFAALSPADLQLLFEMYDRTFFDGHCQRLVDDRIQFRVSRRMTKVGGKTFRTDAGICRRFVRTRSPFPRRCCSRPSEPSRGRSPSRD